MSSSSNSDANQTTSADLQSAVSSAKDQFSDAAPTAVSPCRPGKRGKKKVKPPCSAAKVKKQLHACDGGTHLWAEAKHSLGKEPQVRIAAVPGGFEANTNIVTGVITIAPTPDCCSATQSLFFELTNARSKGRHEQVNTDVANGDVSRNDYAKRIARIEYDGVILLRDTFAKCRAAWGCSATATTGYEAVSNDFDTYYKSQTERYKDYYRNFWDSNYKAGYEAKHPAPARGGH